MPSKHMLPKGKRRQSVRAQYRAARDAAAELAEQEPAGEEASPSGKEEDIAPSSGERPGAKAPLVGEPVFRGLKAPAPSEKTKTDSSAAGKAASVNEASFLADEGRPSAAKALSRSGGFSGTAKAVPLSKASFLPGEGCGATLSPGEERRAGVSAAEGTRRFVVPESAAGMRLDAFLAQAIPDISRARAQLLIESGQVAVRGAPAKASHKLRAGETIHVEGEARPEPLHATPEDIPLEILYEDQYLAVVNKPAGMMVHAGAGASDDARSRGTLVNALLHHMGRQLSQAGGELRPGIVHRLDKETSGAIVVAKDDVTHRRLSEMFSGRRVHKSYVALVHGTVAKDDVTVDLPVARDLVRRTRMTTRRADGRHAVSHVHVLERLSTPYGGFTLVEVRIETGRTHQIRVHMQSLGNPVVGDTLYGAPRTLTRRDTNARLMRGVVAADEEIPKLDRNFLHAAHLEFAHPQTGKTVSVDAPLPGELQRFLSWLRSKGGQTGRKTATVG